MAEGAAGSGGRGGAHGGGGARPGGGPDRRLAEKMIRDNRRAIKLLDEMSDTGTTDGVEVESIEGMLEGYMDPGGDVP